MSVTAISRTATTESDQQENRLLTFLIGGQTFAVEVKFVHRIMDFAPYTIVPGASAYASEIINVAGSIASVVDLRHCFGLAPAADDRPKRIIVFDLTLAGETLRLAAYADAVLDVVDGTQLSYEAVPSVGPQWRRNFVHGVAEKGNTLIIVLDLEQIITIIIQETQSGTRGRD